MTHTLVSWSASAAEDSNDKNFYKWLGFDRHKKVIYGLKCELETFRKHQLKEGESPVYELVKFCLFTRKIIVFKRLELPADFQSENHYIAASNGAISKNGDFIALPLQYFGSEIDLSEDRFYVVLIKVETGDFEIYPILQPDDAFFNFGDLYCKGVLANGNEWVMKFENETQMRQLYYHLTFDDMAKQGRLTFMLDDVEFWIRWNVNPEFFIDDNKLIMMRKGEDIFINNGGTLVYGNINIKICVFDIINKDVTPIPSLPVLDKKYEDKFQILSQADTNLMAVTWSSDSFAIFFKYDSIAKFWNRVNTNCNVSHKDTTRVLRTPTSVVFLQQCRKLGGIFWGTIVNFGNVLSLKDICFLKMFDACKFSPKCTEDEILSNAPIASLPTFLKRQYFGPTYTLEGIEKR